MRRDHGRHERDQEEDRDQREGERDPTVAANQVEQCDRCAPYRLLGGDDGGRVAHA